MVATCDHIWRTTSASRHVSSSFHLIQRARSACFPAIDDRLAYLDRLVTFASHCECIVHGYVLMPNHVHLLLTAPDFESALELDRRLRMSRAREEPELRPIHARRYLLGCMRYIELNPVRALMVRQPQDYRWSSYRANALGFNDPAVTPHPLYYALGRSPESRRRKYSGFVMQGGIDLSD